MATALTPNLKLRLPSTLTADAVYNLNRLDLLGATVLTDSNDTLRLRGRGDVAIEPESADIGGSGVGGSVTVGTADHVITDLTIYASSLNIRAPLSLLDQASAGSKYLLLQYKSDISGSTDSSANRTLSFDLQGANRNLTLGGNFSTAGGNLLLTMGSDSSIIVPSSGTLATLAGAEVLTNKSIDADDNTITNIRAASIASNAAIPYTALSLTGSIVSADISASAAIPYSKLVLTGSVVDADLSSSAAISRSKLAAGTAGHVLINDGSGNISSTAAISVSQGGTGGTDGASARSGLGLGTAAVLDVGLASGDVVQLSGTATLPALDGSNLTGITVDAGDLTGVLAVANGGTGEITANAGLNALLPDQTGNGGKLLTTDGTDTSWTAAATGTVTSVAMSVPSILSVSGSPITTTGTLAVSLATQNANLVWAGPDTGAAATPTFRSLVVADIPSGVDHGGLAGLGDDDHTQYHTDARAVTWLGTRSTTDLPEGTNLYYTAERVDDRVAALLTAGAGISLTYSDEPADTLEIASTITQYTDELAQDAVGGILANTNSITLTYTDGTPEIVADLELSVAVADASHFNAVASIEADGLQVQVADADVLAVVDTYKYKATWVNADTTTKVVTHSLGSADVMCQIYDIDSGETIYVDTVVRTDTNTVTLTANQAPSGAGSGWRVLIIRI